MSALLYHQNTFMKKHLLPKGPVQSKTFFAAFHKRTNDCGITWSKITGFRDKFFRMVVISLLAFIMPLAAWTQATLSGTVTYKGRPLPGASIVVNSTSRGTITDIEGKYSLRLPAGTYTITASNLGFVSKTVDVKLADGEQKTVDVELEEGINALEDLIIVGTRALPRSPSNTPLPVDILSSADIKSTGQSSFDKALMSFFSVCMAQS